MRLLEEIRQIVLPFATPRVFFFFIALAGTLQSASVLVRATFHDLYGRRFLLATGTSLMLIWLGIAIATGAIAISLLYDRKASRRSTAILRVIAVSTILAVHLVISNSLVGHFRWSLSLLPVEAVAIPISVSMFATVVLAMEALNNGPIPFGFDEISIARLTRKPLSVRGVYVIVVLAASGWFGISYFQHSDRPSPQNLGWLTWWDQSRYYQLALALSKLSVAKSEFLVPAGYPAVGIPFLPFWPDIFFFPNLLLFVSSALAVFYLVKRTTKSVSAGLLTTVFYLAMTPSPSYFAEPWSNHAFTSSITLIPVLLLNSSASAAALASLLFGWTFAARYVDAFFLTPLMLLLFWSGVTNRSPRRLLSSSIPAAIVAAGVLSLHARVFGSIGYTPYSQYGEQAGGNLDDLLRFGASTYFNPNFTIEEFGRRIYCVLFDPIACAKNPLQSHVLSLKQPLLNARTWFIIFSPLGLAQLLRKRLSKHLVAYLVLLSFLFETIFYTSIQGWEGGASYYFRYHEVWWPLASVSSGIGLHAAARLFGSCRVRTACA